MSERLIDNSSSLTMLDALKECMGLKNLQQIRIATGYWDLPGMGLLIQELEDFLKQDNAKIQLLIGRDPYLYASQFKEGLEYPKDHIKLDIVKDMNFKDEADMRVVKLLWQYCQKDNRKLEIKLYQNPDDKSQFLHAKCYIFTSLPKEEEGFAIMGSSNFTKPGLTEQGNSELNWLTDNYYMIDPSSDSVKKKTIGKWFDDKWENNSIDWTEEFLLQVLGQTEIGKKAKEEMESEGQPVEDTPNETTALTPYETYIKFLQMHYGNVADATVKEQLISYLPNGFNTLEFQLDAVTQCFEKLRDYKGFFLSDVVGLGKTIVGLLLIKKFIEEAETIHHRKPKVLIVTPPAIKGGWEDAITKFDEGKPYPIAEHITFITTGSIGNLLDDEDVLDSEDGDVFDGDMAYDDYGLILIDESHNFRNSETQKYKALKGLIETITIRGIQPYVGLLSATPQNNSPKDLRNQIYLFQLNPGDSDFEINQRYGNKLDSYFVDKQEEFERCKNDKSEKSKKSLLQLATDIREHILEHIVVRRTRSDIENTYKDDYAKLKFPKVCPPHKLIYKMDDELVKLFSETITTILSPQKDEPIGTEHLGYYRYCAIMYFKDAKNTKLYEKRNLTVSGISARIAKIMRILLVKRIESSFSAFTKSLENLTQYTENMLVMLQNDCVFICPDIDVNKEFEKHNFNWSLTAKSIRELIAKKGGNNREFRRDDFKSEYQTNIEEDIKLLKALCKKWRANDLDPKKDAFHEAVKDELFADQINNPHHYDQKRLVIFTEAKDTQAEITRYLKQVEINGVKPYRVLEISASNRDKEHMQIISENFDANSKVQKDDYNVIVTTEVLAEGVNLHRSNVILNYDTPWNATRLMQRIGRVNRIGSKEEEIHVFNFFPTPQSNAQIHLIEKAYAKLQAFHTMFGEDSQIYSEEEEVTEANFNKQVEGENTPDALYIKELRDFQLENPKAYQKLLETEAKGIGGMIEGRSESLFVLDAKYRNRSCFIVSDDGTVQHVMPLAFIEKLRCEKDATYAVLDEKRYKTISESVLKAYALLLNRTKNAKDANKRMSKALGLASKLRDKLSTTEAKLALNGLDTAIRSNNTAAIRLIENFDPNILFNPNEDINEKVTTLFKNIAAQATQKYGEPYVSLFTIS